MVLNTATFIHRQSLLLLEKLNEFNLDIEADMCEKLHEDADMLCWSLSVRLHALQDAG